LETSFHRRPPFIGDLHGHLARDPKILVGDLWIFFGEPNKFIGDPQIFIGDPKIFLGYPKTCQWRQQIFDGYPMKNGDLK